MSMTYGATIKIVVERDEDGEWSLNSIETDDKPEPGNELSEKRAAEIFFNDVGVNYILWDPKDAPYLCPRCGHMWAEEDLPGCCGVGHQPHRKKEP